MDDTQGHARIAGPPSIEGRVDGLLALRTAGDDAVREYLATVPAERWSAFAGVASATLDDRLRTAAANVVLAQLLQVTPALPEYIAMRRLQELLVAEQRRRRAR